MFATYKSINVDLGAWCVMKGKIKIKLMCLSYITEKEETAMAIRLFQMFVWTIVCHCWALNNAET